MAHSETVRLARHPSRTASNSEHLFSSMLPETDVRLCSPIVDTPYWSSFSSCWSNLYGGPDTIPCRQKLLRFSFFRCSEILFRPLFYRPVSVPHTHSSPDNPNPLSRASNRNQALSSPVIASLTLHAGVIFFMPAQSLRWAR